MGHERKKERKYYEVKPSTVCVLILPFSHSLCISPSLLSHSNPLGGGWSRSWLHPPTINTWFWPSCLSWLYLPFSGCLRLRLIPLIAPLVSVLDFFSRPEIKFFIRLGSNFFFSPSPPQVWHGEVLQPKRARKLPQLALA